MIRKTGGLILALALAALSGAAAPVMLGIDAGPEFYPAEAAALKLEGDVTVTLGISAGGEIRCAAKSDAALAALRRPSCALIVSRNVFMPAVRDGKIQPTDYELVVRWRAKNSTVQFGGAVPVAREHWVTYADYPAIAGQQMLTGKVEVAFDISEQGRAENCRVTRTNATRALSGAVCPLVLSRAIFLPALTPEGQPRRSQGELKTEWFWPDQCRGKKCGPPDIGL